MYSMLHDKPLYILFVLANYLECKKSAKHWERVPYLDEVPHLLSYLHGLECKQQINATISLVDRNYNLPQKNSLMREYIARYPGCHLKRKRKVTSPHLNYVLITSNYLLNAILIYFIETDPPNQILKPQTKWNRGGNRLILHASRHVWPLLYSYHGRSM